MGCINRSQGHVCPCLTRAGCCMGMQASPVRDDVPVPAPFPANGAASEDALGVKVVGASSSGAHYQSIEQVCLQLRSAAAPEGWC